MKVADRQAKEREPLRIKERLKEAIERQRIKRITPVTKDPQTTTKPKERKTKLAISQGF